jgi:hypothetical protein
LNSGLLEVNPHRTDGNRNGWRDNFTRPGYGKIYFRKAFSMRRNFLYLITSLMCVAALYAQTQKTSLMPDQRLKAIVNEGREILILTPWKISGGREDHLQHFYLLSRLGSIERHP